MRTWLWLLVQCVSSSVALAGSCPELVYRGVNASFLARSGDFMYTQTIGSDAENRLITLASEGTAAPRVVGEIGGVTRGSSLVTDGDWLYSLDPWSLVVYSGATSGNLGERSRLQIPYVSGVDAVDVDDGLVLIGGRDRGVRVVDYRDPDHPFVAGMIGSGGEILTIALADGFAYLGDLDAGLRVFDLSNPETPREVAGLPISWTSSGGYPFGGVDISVTDDLMVITAAETLVIDVSDPSSPEIVSTLPSARYAAVDGRRLVLEESRRLHAYDLSDPRSPRYLGSVELPITVFDLDLANGIATTVGNGIMIIDASDNGPPNLVQQLPGARGVEVIALNGEFAYIAQDDSNGFVSLDLAEPALPVLRGATNWAGATWARGLAVDQGLAVLGNASRRELVVIDVADSSQPARLGEYRTSGGYSEEVYDVDLQSELAALAGTFGVEFLDLADPSDPVLVGAFGGNPVYDVDLDGSRAYLATGSVVVLDISEPGDPIEIGQVGLSQAYRVAVRDEIVATTTGNLVALLDFTNLADPSILSTFVPREFVRDLLISNQYLVLSGEHIEVVDISDPTRPRHLGIGGSGGGIGGGIDSRNSLLATAFDAGFAIWELSSCDAADVRADFIVESWLPRLNEPIRFKDLSSGVVTSWAWDFGNGEISTEQHPTHTYTVPGMYVVSLVVTDSSGSDLMTRAIDLTERTPTSPPITTPAEFRTVVPAVAHIGPWQTDLELHNPGREVATAHLYMLPRLVDGSDSPGLAVETGAGSTTRLQDVVQDWLSAGRDAAGGLLINSDHPLIVGSRTAYSIDVNAGGGTYAQAIPGVNLDSGGAPASVFLVGLSESDAFRSNVGFTNPTSDTVNFGARVFAADGTELGARYFSVMPYSNAQANQFLEPLIDTGEELDLATVAVFSSAPEASVIVYASVVDNGTGDPTYLAEAMPVMATETVDLLGVAHNRGDNYTWWETAVVVFNPGSSSTDVELKLCLQGSPGEARTENFQIQAGETIRFEDVVSSVFGENGLGVLRVTPVDGRVVVSARTATASHLGTFGQGIPPYRAAQAVSSDQEARLIQLSDSGRDDYGFRTNLGLFALEPATVTIDLYSGSGSLLGSIAATLAREEFRQIDDVFRHVSQAPVVEGFAILRSDSPVHAYASVIDNRTGDPFLVVPRGATLE